ncbi:hypothetical protein J7M23_05865 [Candidatus Sumerlaeota bacterium]|nr:hypothetical protein [Candidatus Sumerlaeota bacterium]
MPKYRCVEKENIRISYIILQNRYWKLRGGEFSEWISGMRSGRVAMGSVGVVFFCDG